MTIRTVENLSGMTRANIRFYEVEGLISPQRGENGYRDYSEQDLEILKRIRLLRALRIPLEEIKALQSGQKELLAALDEQIEVLAREQKLIGRSQEVCREMRADGVQYETLNAQRYLDALMQEKERADTLALTEDVLPHVRAPWRRYFARSLDLGICNICLSIVLTVAFRVNLALGGNALRLAILAAGLMLMMFFEPLLLSKFGTTPGKWILGLSVTDEEGGKLTYSGAQRRTVGALIRGMGLNIPLYGWYRLYKSYAACADGQRLTWEEGSVLVLRDEKPWRVAVYAGAHAVAVGALTLAVICASFPPHRGEISAAEFCDNFNRLAEYYDVFEGRKLDSEGHWISSHPSGREFAEDRIAQTDFLLTEENGVLQSVSFACRESDRVIYFASDLQDRMFLSALSFALAQQRGLPLAAQKEIAEQISAHPFEEFSFTVNGVNIACKAEYENAEVFTSEESILLGIDGGVCSYQVSFEMSRQ